MNTIASYANGNLAISIYPDGTKSREWEGAPAPIFPESIDLKITDYCDAGCPYCHEQSTRRGTHAPADAVLAAVAGLPAGVEIAIGGGNPLSHPDLVPILSAMRAQGLIPNLTVNSFHLAQYETMIRNLRRRGLIFGLGVSYDPAHLPATIAIIDDNTVLHFIAGVHRPIEARRLLDRPRKFLILGYKQFGFGLRFYKPKVERRLAEWRYWIGTLMRHPNACVSFDNLGLEQLRIREWLPDGVWRDRFMGDDGTFTMYVDAVAGTFAATSTGRRVPIDGMGIGEMFAVVRAK